MGESNLYSIENEAFAQLYIWIVFKKLLYNKIHLELHLIWS